MSRRTDEIFGLGNKPSKRGRSHESEEFNKPLKVPSLARSVPKPLKVPSLASSVPKLLKVPSFASSVPKPLLIVPRCRLPPPAVKERSDWLRIVMRELLRELLCELLRELLRELLIRFWYFIFPETYICYRRYFNLNFYIGKKVQKNFLMGLKIW